MQVKSTKSKEIREGIEYSTSVDFNNTDIEAIHTIPEIIEPPAQICVDAESALGADIVVFDLETTGFGYDADIVQISAEHGGRQFNKYILPKKPNFNSRIESYKN